MWKRISVLMEKLANILRIMLKVTLYKASDQQLLKFGIKRKDGFNEGEVGPSIRPIAPWFGFVDDLL